MVVLGLYKDEKKDFIEKFSRENDINKIYFISPEKFFYDVDYKIEYIRWEDVIEYSYFYRLLSDIRRDDLIVVNELIEYADR